MSEKMKEQNAQELAAPAGEEELNGEGQMGSVETMELEPGDADEPVVIHDADAEDALEEAALRRAADEQNGDAPDDEDAPPGVRSMAELMAIIEALIFVSEEPLSAKAIADLL